ncbi:hypothetical protein [Sphingomonas bacterium]|uniref:hypothetical protein n=1 Tax=Sphingomonas bacterium TaxID=1895847 RepID=UPI001576E115|nr:hypothetical protein [Sphingomonas bacterium]
MEPVPADLLAQALTISNRHVAIGQKSNDDDGGFEEDEAFQSAFEDMQAAVGDKALARRIDARLYHLRDFLSGEGAAHYSVKDDGTVAIDEDLLAFAATTPITEHPDDRLKWSPEQDQR